MDYKKYIFSHYALIGIIIIIGVATVFAMTTSEDIDEVCYTNNSIFKRGEQNWSCSVTNYAEGYYQNAIVPITLTYDNSSHVVNVTGFIPSNYYGFTWVGDGVTASKDGLYRLSATITLVGTNGDEVGFAMRVNNVTQYDCAAGLTAENSKRNNVGITCLKEIKAGDHLHVISRDQDGAGAVNIYTMNFNIVEVQ